MVSSLNQSKAAHQFGYQAINYLRNTINADAGGAVVNVILGKLPIGAVIVGVHSRVSVAITGGTPVLSLGETGDAGLDNIVLVLAETAGSELVQPLTAFGGPLAAEVEVRATITGGATAGSATITVLYSTT